jgi:hypothetical protein
VLLVAGVLILVHAEHHEEDKGGLIQLSGHVRQFLEHLIVWSNWSGRGTDADASSGWPGLN